MWSLGTSQVCVILDFKSLNIFLGIYFSDKRSVMIIIFSDYILKSIFVVPVRIKTYKQYKLLIFPGLCMKCKSWFLTSGGRIQNLDFLTNTGRKVTKLAGVAQGEIKFFQFVDIAKEYIIAHLVYCIYVC